ncbi:DUF63 family protein [Methermicoccus shengliensis]|uniref:DUF63 family protein n=1 Tax=Methermicoccus shengliensis TaxID=660064 RepID=UPI0005B26F46|nr:DUF63 family protein [Methermicoccus shengliensis]
MWWCGDVVSTLSEFVHRYYIDPIVYDTGYNVVNTLTWALVLGLSLFGVYRLLKRLGVRIDSGFILALAPYIAMGSLLRVVEDARIVLPPLSYLLITPLIYFVVFAVAIVLLAACVFVWGGISRRTRVVYGLCGAVLDIGLLSLLLHTASAEAWVPMAIVGLSIVAFLAVFVGMRPFTTLLLSPINAAIVWAHMFDASSTFVGIDFLGYVEKHVLPTLIIEHVHTALVMYPLKLGIYLPVLYLIDVHMRDEGHDFIQLLKLTLLVLGLAPAMRNTLRMTLGI